MRLAVVPILHSADDEIFMLTRIILQVFINVDYSMHERVKGDPMQKTVVTMLLNQQQLELIDRIIASGIASDRASLVRQALRAQAARQAAAETSTGGKSNAA